MKKPSESPRRALNTNFTEQTLSRALSAKKRYERKRRFERLFTMKINGFLRQPAGVLLAFAIVVASGAGVYAATNWFNGTVKVTDDSSIMTVDLSACSSPLPGIEPTDDRKNLQFKIVGEPHIDAKSLEKKLLTECEFASVDEFYRGKMVFPELQAERPSIVKAVTAQTITFETSHYGKVYDKTFPITSDVTFYDKGRAVQASSMKPGDFVVFLFVWAYHPRVTDELHDPMDGVTHIQSVFKTQYDTRAIIEDAKDFYGKDKIMPLAVYNQLQNKK